ncbi:pectinesterase [Selaginella moellendorffii]|uniref:pectinesterase n=1 Tax=Selaginella moellendorffii TaxID=88036 RepID=UPI000D1C3DB7|nr:pectinesterase [Selaginella moellendorffii]|eukprot:XP_024542976.1 pectinesterase [Selaginella moellendorffii]
MATVGSSPRHDQEESGKEGKDHVIGNAMIVESNRVDHQNPVNDRRCSRFLRRPAVVLAISLLFVLIVSLSISLPLVLLKKKRGEEFTVSNACKSTRFPDVCLSSLARSQIAKSGPRELLEETTRAAIQGVEEMLNLTAQFMSDDHHHHSVRAKAAFDDCSELLGSAIAELQASLEEFVQGRYESEIADIQTWMSAALTFHDTCMDELDEVSGDPEVKRLRAAGQRVQKLISNALALVNPMVAAWRASLAARGQRGSAPPALVAAGRGLVNGAHVVDAVVAQDGSGQFGRIQDAINAAPRMSARRYVIHIKAGVYREYVTVRSFHTNLMFVGDGQGRTIITGNKNVMQPGITTRTSATVVIEGKNFMARELTIENTSGPQAQQAVALRVGADQAAFYRCSIHGNQDTLLAHVFRQFYRECTVTGTVDFVFGNAAAVFQNCSFESKVPVHGQQTVVSAQGRSDPAQNTGFSFHMCRVGGAFPVYLGRPWKEFARVVWLRSQMEAMVQPRGWLSWEGGSFGLQTSYFAEYKNWGPGSSMRDRVKWVKVLNGPRLARKFTPSSFIAAQSWLPKTSFIFDSKL